MSIEQEKLMNEVSITGTKDPRFKELAIVQHKQLDDAKHIGDSLYAKKELCYGCDLLPTSEEY